MELFMYGDPRLLAGGKGTNSRSRDSYESAPPTVAGRGIFTEDLEQIRKTASHGPTMTPFDLAELCGQIIHHGKVSYHATPTYNNFLVDGQWPSAGIELETILSRYSDEFSTSACNDMRSNWFHFERDGSLDRDHSGTYGFELITEPLPPRVYRDPRTWAGLENVISPWLESFDHEDTGLHIHVGLCQFAGYDTIPLKNPDSRMNIGKIMSLLVYYVLAGSALIDRVTLRKNTHYCGASANDMLFSDCEYLESGKMTGAEFVDFVVSKITRESSNCWVSAISDSLHDSRRSHYPMFCTNNLGNTTSHSTEVNCEHRYTIEFRRGKGTCHALSIHRMVELMTGIVRYAGKCCREPNMNVSRESFLDFIYRTTTSEVLKNMIKR